LLKTQEQRRPNRNRAQWIQELNLTPEQTQIRRFEISIKTRFPNAGKQRQAKQELLELMAGKASESQIREKYRQVETLNSKLQTSDLTGC